MSHAETRTGASEPLWLGEPEVAGLIALGEAIEAVERALGWEAAGRAQTMEKTHVSWEGGHTLHALGAEAAAEGFVGAKSWAHTGGGASPLFLLWESGSGRLLAVLEAFVLGQLRTAAVSAVATRWLALPEADELAIIGSGKQALPQVAAVAAVRRISHVRVFSPSAEHRSAFAARLSAAGFGFTVSEARSVADAVASCPIITTATRAREPFLDVSMVSPAALVNAMGAITPERRELSAALVERARPVVADSPATARRLGVELTDAAEIVPLSRIVREARARTSGGRPALFKAMGLGLADLALAIEVWRRATAKRVGRPLPSPRPAAPRLQGESP